MILFRRKPQRDLRRAAQGISLTYLVGLALIAFWPTPVDGGIHGSISSVVFWLRAHGMPHWLDYATIEFGANILLFVPIGLLVVVIAGARRWWLGPLTGAGLSMVIELGQLVFLPERFATVNDVIANTLGALLGAIIAVVIVHLTVGPSRASAPASQRF